MAPVTEKSLAAPATYKQPSRKGKKAWRKNVDVSDVQAGLEEAREEVIKHGGIIAEKPSDALFTLDTSGSAAIQKSYNKIHKPLKADQILAQRSTIEQVDTRKRPRGVTDGVIEPGSKKRKSDGVSRKEYQRLRQVAYNGSRIEAVIKNDDAPGHDPWAVTIEEQDPRFDYLERKKPIVAPVTLKEAPISLAEGGKKVPAVGKPRTGTSYNPVFEEWEALLTAEGLKEVQRERKRLAEAKVELERLERIAAAEQEREREEGVQTEDESAWEGFENEVGDGELKKKRPERKTPQERRKVEKRKERERTERHEKKMKERNQREKRILEIKAQVDSEVKERALVKAAPADAENSEEERDDTVLRRRKLGKDALPEAPLELVLPDELQDSLRLLKPEGNLLKERFRNIMVRGKMESRPKPIQQAKKKKRTFTEKWTYKDFKVGA